MSQFRNTADVLDEILQEAGEPTNGNSLYETAAVIAANHVHHAIIGGGNIFNVNVDEPWVWARSKLPIIFDLQPGVTAQATLTNGNVSISFTPTPTTNYSGWYAQVLNESTVYRIANHDSAGTSQINYVTASAVPTSGSLVLNFDGYNLTAAWNSTYQSLQSAWNAIIPNGQWLVTSDLSSKKITVIMNGLNGPQDGFNIVSNSLLNGTTAVTVIGGSSQTGVAATPSATAQLDSDYLGTATSASVRLFKLDYNIQQSYFAITDSNDRLEFSENGVTTSLVFQHGVYSAQGLASQIMSTFNSTAYYGVWYDSLVNKFAFASSITASFLGATGQYAYKSILPTLGFAPQDYTGAQSYTAQDVPNRIARMIEPFKCYMSDRNRPFIYSTDPIKMQEDYPIAFIQSRLPDRFSRVSADTDGSITVRFNAYPSTASKVQVDWIPQPLDLVDNAMSKVLVPRGDLKTFIYAAASFIMFQKEDTKFKGMLGLARAGLDAMKKKNHGELFRTGEHFGQQVPRADLDRRHRNRWFRYGYTSSDW